MADQPTEEKLSEMLRQGKMKYQLINAVAKRARQINEGMRPTVPGSEGLDPLSAAMAELRSDKLRIRKIEPKDQEAEEPEEE